MILMPGAVAPDYHLIFVMKGLLALYEEALGAAVGALGPNSILGELGPKRHDAPTKAKAILETVVYVVPIAALSQVSGVTWSTRFLTAHASSRARLVGVEKLCLKSHTSSERLAKWCGRLAPSLSEGHLRLTIEDLAALVGIGEAEVLQAWDVLAADGAVSNHPGDFSGLSPVKLRAHACCCDEALGDGGMERRNRRRLMRRH